MFTYELAAGTRAKDHVTWQYQQSHENVGKPQADKKPVHKTTPEVCGFQEDKTG